jgi:peptidoglycan LD-endopeptidase CwlK
MPSDLTLLVPSFKVNVLQLLENCRAQGVEMRPFYTLRSPFEQAKLWRQSRSTEEVNRAIEELHEKNCHFLAHCLTAVGMQEGRPVTNALPGLSWHQWGEAVDCFWFANGEAVWDIKKRVNGVKGYDIYAQEAKKIELESGHFWQPFQDTYHVQQRPDPSPLALYSYQKIDQIMKQRFG